MTPGFSRWWPRARQIGLVTLVTLLIWLWAEAESLKSAVGTTRVLFTRTPDVAVRVVGPGDQAGRDSIPVRVRLEGSSGAIDEAQRTLGRELEVTPGVGAVPGPPGGTVNLLEAVSQSRDLKRTGVTVVSVEPASAVIRVVNLVTRDLPVQPELTGIEVEGDVTVVPPTVRVTMPEELARTLPPGTPVLATIGPDDLAAVREGSREEGLQQVVQARLRLPAALSPPPPGSQAGGQPSDADLVRLWRETVQVRLRVRRRVESLELPQVPVWICLPPIEGTGWDVELVEPFLRGVTVTGPTDLVERIRRRELVPIAFVMLSSDELRAGLKSKPAVFAPVPAELVGAGPTSSPRAAPPVGEPGAAPTGGAGLGEAAMMEQVAPLKFSAENRRVELRIRKRTGAEKTPGATGAGLGG